MGDGQDVTSHEGVLVEKVKKITDEIAGQARCHNVLVRRKGDKFSVSLHCRFEKDLSIIQVHDLSSRIEERLKNGIPGVDYVLVHAEPAAR
jgi:divalent metal cation (Fe/Co/Zn/Cd) transporter